MRIPKHPDVPKTFSRGAIAGGMGLPLSLRASPGRWDNRLLCRVGIRACQPLACIIADVVETPSTRVGLLMPLIFTFFGATACEASMIHREQGIQGTRDLALLLGLVSVGAVLGVLDAPVP